MPTTIHYCSDHCRYCGSGKHVQLTYYEMGGQPALQKTCSIQEYRALHQSSQNIGVDAVWCSSCGMLYHPSSI